MGPSNERVAVRVGGLAHNDQDGLHEGPWTAHEETNEGDAQDELCDAHSSLTEIEVMHAEWAEEKGQQKGDNLLFGGCGGHRCLHFWLHKVKFQQVINNISPEHAEKIQVF